MIKSLVRPHLINLQPYVSARDLYSDGVFLNANENCFGSVIELPLFTELNRYPDPKSSRLKKALAKYLSVSAENIFVGVGSDEIIGLIMQVFVDPGDEVVILEPTYPMYGVVAGIHNALIKTCRRRDDFYIDFAALEKTLNRKTKLIFCATPNNPTGTGIGIEDLERLCRTAKNALVVIDEAYIEFSSEKSAVSLLTSYENLIVLRTFSKAWGLAGLRVGYAIATPEVVSFLTKIKFPYNLNAISAALAEKALKMRPTLEKYLVKIRAEKDALEKYLIKLGCTVYPSEANFFLVKVRGASKVVKELAEEYGVIVRDFSDKPGLVECFRVTVGTPEQNRLFITSLSSLL